MSERENMGLVEILQEMAKLTMKESIEIAWNDSEEELMNRLKSMLATPDDEWNPGPFTIMQTVGLVGTILTIKYKKNENELMRLVKDSNVNFVKEIIND